MVAGDPAPPTCPNQDNPFTSVVARYRSTNNGLSLDVGPDEILKLGRYFAIPDGATIEINTDQDWDLPIGSVAMKTFSVGGKRIEARLFMRHDDGGWGGYTYEWNAAGTEAALLPAGKVRALDDGALWAYPSRTQCLQCATKLISPGAPQDSVLSLRLSATDASGCRRWRST